MVRNSSKTRRLSEPDLALPFQDDTINFLRQWIMLSSEPFANSLFTGLPYTV
jgi:hypothetical protein